MMLLSRKYSVFVIVVCAIAGLGAFAIQEWRAATLDTPQPSLLLVDRSERFIADVAVDPALGNGYWPVDGLPERVVQATLALEDKRFWWHPGVDPISVVRAVVQNVSAGERESGASTIAMQVARLQHPAPRTYVNKAREAVRALFLTLRHGREAILAHYLRLVPYGNNSHGIAHAAQRYLNKPVSHLSWAEIAFLSALPQAPSLMNPFIVSGRVRAIERGRRILDNLKADGVIGPVDYDLAVQQIGRLKVTRKPRREASLLHAVTAMSGDLRARYPVGGKISTGLDLDIQAIVYGRLVDALERWRVDGAEQAAAVVRDIQSGDIVAWVGSGDYFDADAGALDYVRAMRPPGSTLKPFLYALALERGILSPSTVLDDLADTAKGFRNSDRRFLGPMLPRQALANSRNVPAVAVLDSLGLEEAYFYLRDLGALAGQANVRDYGLGLAMGGAPTTLENLIDAYSILAGEGQARPLSWLKSHGNEPKRRLMSEATARQITGFLSDPQARLPSFQRMGAMEFQFPVALKTGTSKGYRDGWTFAYSKRYLVGVWVGRPDAKSMKRLGGVNSAAELAGTILRRLHPESGAGMANTGFPKPRGAVDVALCTRTGKRDRGFCDSVLTEWVPRYDVPEADDRYGMVAVDGRNGLRATAWTPQRHLRMRRAVTLPVKYASWAAENNLPLPPATFSTLDVPENRTVEAISPKTVGDAPRIVFPQDGLQIATLPDSAVQAKFLALKARVEGGAAELLWYIDGRPFKVVKPPFDLLWSIEPGRHTFELGVPGTTLRSSPVSIVVHR